jgi:hypothetical protein
MIKKFLKPLWYTAITLPWDIIGNKLSDFLISKGVDTNKITFMKPKHWWLAASMLASNAFILWLPIIGYTILLLNPLNFLVAFYSVLFLVAVKLGLVTLTLVILKTQSQEIKDDIFHKYTILAIQTLKHKIDSYFKTP